MEERTEEKKSENYSLSFLSIGILAVFLLIVGGVYYFVSKKSKGQVVFPAGVNYTGAETTPKPQKPQYDFANLASAADWTTFTSPKGQYSFKYPASMIPLVFPGDANDSMTFDIADVPVQFNLMVLYETISSYDSKLVGKPEEFVKNYWKFFGGLKGEKDFQPFETDKGLKGWKVSFTMADRVGTDNYFFINPKDPDKILHVNNIFPEQGQGLFVRLLNSFEIKK